MKRLLPLALIFILLLSACTTNTGTPSPAPASPTAAITESPAPSTAPARPELPPDFPRIDGSTATIPLAEAIYAIKLGIAREEAAEMVLFNGTTTSYEQLFYGAADLVIAYEPTAGTLDKYAEQGVPLEVTAIGRDALVFLLNVQNPVNEVSADELREIYAADGTIKSWSDLGGGDTDIVPYQRNYDSGSQVMMQKLVMGDRPIAEPPTFQVVSEMGMLIDVIADYDNGASSIGYNVYYFVSRMNPNPNIKLLSIDNVIPSNETIASGEYPFVNDFYVAIRADEPTGSPARELYDWLIGDEGRELLRDEGYVAINN
ncbi:MAG: substrate-binding domain-containing protein [Oscillospiraceae bacterium]|jgi:phosphate transport system substrate-binding protein|nr:substrate-binding domain-containing protein [Oscillospiraceae bacterium]